MKERKKMQINVTNSVASSPQKLNTTQIATAISVHGSGETQWWFDARGSAAKKDLLKTIETSNCTHIILTFEQHKLIKTSKQRVVWINDVDQIQGIDENVWVFTDKEPIREAANSKKIKAGLFIDVNDLEREFPRCVEVCERGDDFVVIDIEHATYIPYELLLAKAEGKPTKVLRSVPIKGLEGIVDPINQSLNAFATMEQGIGVVFQTDSTDAIENLSNRLINRQHSRLQLVSAKVVDVQHTGLGHRVCVDTTTMMSAEEGMLIGSTGWGGIFVCSETHYLPHMNLREFRVNAGAVHSYVWGPNGKVLYLSELKAGSEVLVADRYGNTRVVTVGRTKVERRPMLKIQCSISLDQVSPDIRKAIEVNYLLQRSVTPEGEKLSAEDLQNIYVNTFLQNDWHVRVMGADGKIRHSTLVKPGDELIVHVDLPGRHTGLRVTEHILEK